MAFPLQSVLFLCSPPNLNTFCVLSGIPFLKLPQLLTKSGKLYHFFFHYCLFPVGEQWLLIGLTKLSTHDILPTFNHRYYFLTTGPHGTSTRKRGRFHQMYVGRLPGLFKEKIPETIHSLRPCHREPQHLRGRESEETGDAWELMIKTGDRAESKDNKPTAGCPGLQIPDVSAFGPCFGLCRVDSSSKEPRTLLDDLNLNTKIII